MKNNSGFKVLSSFLILISVLALFYYFLSTQLAQVAPKRGLVAHWKFNEGSGSAASDSSGNGNTVTLSNGPTWAAGKIGGAIHTDGKDDLLRINPASFDFNGDITVATWIKQELTGGDGSQSTLIVSADSSGRKFTVFLDRANKRFCIQFNSCTDFDTYTVVGSWFHFVLTKSATRSKIYVNGSPIGSDLVTENVTGDDIGIGGHTSLGSRHCNCSFDEFRVYNRTLSAQEIAEIYNDK